MGLIQKLVASYRTKARKRVEMLATEGLSQQYNIIKKDLRLGETEDWIRETPFVAGYIRGFLTYLSGGAYWTNSSAVDFAKELTSKIEDNRLSDYIWDSDCDRHWNKEEAHTSSCYPLLHPFQFGISTGMDDAEHLGGRSRKPHSLITFWTGALSNKSRNTEIFYRHCLYLIRSQQREALRLLKDANSKWANPYEINVAMYCDKGIGYVHGVISVLAETYQLDDQVEATGASLGIYLEVYNDNWGSSNPRLSRNTFDGTPSGLGAHDWAIHNSMNEAFQHSFQRATYETERWLFSRTRPKYLCRYINEFYT